MLYSKWRWPRRELNVATATRIAGRVAVAAASLATASGLYQLASDQRDRARFPAPGQLVTLPDGNKRHVWVKGSGGPPVVVVTCLGGPAIMWAKHQRVLEEHTQVVLYDRENLGWSPGRPRWQRTIGGMVDELHDVLEAAGIERPVVLVGHSIGGTVARLYAARFPDDVAGIVLVDSSHEHMGARVEKVDPSPWWKSRWGSAWKVRLEWLGLRRLRHDLGLLRDVREDEERTVPPDLVPASVALALASRTRRGDAAELSGLNRGLREVAAGVRHLGDLPLTVITGGIDSEARRRFYSVWLELQAEFLAESTQSRQIMASHTGHHVQRDDPELVVKAITDMVEVVRARGG